jgi:hypothetical protein
MHLDDCSYFIGAGIDTFCGEQAAQYLASCYPENALLRVEFEVCLTHIGEGLRQVGDVRLFFLACNYDVVDIGQYIPTYLVLQCYLHHSTERGAYVAKTFRHSHVAICAKQSYEIGLLFILLAKLYLVIP